MWRIQEKWLGVADYAEVLRLQNSLREQVQTNHTAFILGCEHPSIVTLGIRGQTEDVLEISAIPTLKTDRGGQATLHNPGQLVIYPILPFKQMGFSARGWVDLVSEVTEEILRKRNITIESKEKGIFTKNGKIASFGFNLKKGISSHGVAINICNSLSDFSLIRACGVQNASIDRVCNYSEGEECLPFYLEWTQELQRQLDGLGIAH